MNIKSGSKEILTEKFIRRGFTAREASRIVNNLERILRYQKLVVELLEYNNEILKKPKEERVKEILSKSCAVGN